LSIAVKRVPSKFVSNDFPLQNCFESLSGLENVVAGTDCTTQVELALEKVVASHGLTDVPLDVALVPGVVAHKSSLLIMPDANVAL